MAALLEAEKISETEASGLEVLKKKELVEKAEALMTKSEWLPSLMRAAS